MGRKTPNKKRASYLFLGSLCCLFFMFYPLISNANTEQNPQKEKILESYGKLPLYFIENRGQLDPKVRYYVKTSSQTLYFTDVGIVFDFLRGETEALKGANQDVKAIEPRAQSRTERLVFSLAFDNAREGVSIAGVERQGAKVNYVLGNDKAGWKRDIPTYKGIIYKEVYEGIDFQVCGDGQAIKYDFIVNPGADPGEILLSYNGIEGLRTNRGGALIIKTAFGELQETTPYIYQEIEGEKIEVSGGFWVQETTNQTAEKKSSYGFLVASYNPSYPLIIDPTLHYSTYLGGSGNDSGYGIAVDSSGNAYVTGETASTNFPTQSPYQGAYAGGGDAFITKLSSSGGTLSYSTYLGGSGNDYGYGIAVDSSGNAYVTGYTESSNFPTQSPYQGTYAGGGDAFITKLPSSGSSLAYSTYLGGSNEDFGNRIAVDSSGNAYVTGYTASSNFPTQSPYQGTYAGGGDAFITKLPSSGSSLTYSTYLGGSGDDYGEDIVTDGSGNAFVTGLTASSNFPTQSPYQGTYGGGSHDAFITKLPSSGSSLTYSTYLGGSAKDSGEGIAVDGSGNAYITGYTASSNFPTQSPYQGTYGGGSHDAFITKLPSSGSSLTYSTYLGGSAMDEGNGIVVDGSGNAYITGDTASDDFPTQNPYQATRLGGSDAFATKLSPTGNSLSYSTYFGGSGNDYGYGIAVDGSGNAYITGGTASSNFPTQNSYQESNGGGDDAFILKYQGTDSSPAVNTTTPSAISSLSAVSGGDVTSDGGASVTARGVCWNTSENPTTGDDHTTDGTGTGTFTSNITELTPDTIYYVRAYATNSVETSYGENKSFRTLAAISPGTYYVDIQNGSDSNDGTSSSPWKTLHHGFDQVNGGSTGSSGNEYILNVLLGAEYGTANGELNKELSLSQSHVIVFGEKGSGPVINGANADNWADGIKITGSNIRLVNLHITGFTAANATGINIIAGSNNSIENCRVYLNNDGISVWQSSNCTIQDSEIDNNNFDGISFVESASGVITRNIIHDNYEEDNSDGIIVQACSPEISRNKIYDNRFNVSIQAESSEVTSPTVKNNLIYEDTSGEVDYGIILGGSNTSTVSPKIYHNTIDKGTYEGIIVEKYNTSTVTPEIKYNIVTNFSQYGIQNNSGNPTIDYNDVWNNGSSAADNYKDCTAGTNDISEDPKYGSYKLQSDSPCINKIPLAEEDPVDLDYDGYKRPRPGVETCKDMGAYEYVSDKTDNYTLPGGTGSATDYRIFTVPLKLGTGADMLTAMENVLGFYDPVHWRGFLYRGTGYLEFNTSQFGSHSIVPGMGFWIITTYNNSVPFEGGPAPDGVDYVMDLAPGWHLIALPWTGTRISLGNISVTDGVYTYAITANDNNLTQKYMWDYTGSGPDNGYVKRDTSGYQLEYNKGYFFKVLGEKPIKMIIPHSDNQGQDTYFDVTSPETNTHEDDEAPPPPPGAEPIPDIKVNGQDGPVALIAGDSVTVSISLDPGAWSGRNADWWVAAHTPFDPPLDWYTYVYPEGWRYGIHVCAQTPLFELMTTAPYNVLGTTLPAGNYIFYFAVDGNMDGEPDATWLDAVEVNVE